MNYINNFEEISFEEQYETNGGENVLEYIAMGVGYVVGTIAEAAENAPDYADSAILGPNSRAVY